MKLSNLTLRIISASIMLPFAIFIIWQGGFVYNLAIIFVAVLMAYEWEDITSNSPNKLLWKSLGIIYIALPITSLIYLRDLPKGLEIVIWLFSVIWATDIFAYFGGKLIGGPKLAPKISPGKTWAGLICGVSMGALCGLIIAHFFGARPMGFLIITLIVSIYSQIGDLLESLFKRHFNTKDSSELIPGHGGILDRIDGVILVAPKVALFTLFEYGLF